MKPLEIVYVGSRWDYGDPTRGLSFEETNFRSALEGMGHEVAAYDFLARARAIGRDPMNEELSAFVRERMPDVVVFFLFGDEIAPPTIESLTRLGVPTFNWFADDHWRFDNFSRRYAPCFTLVSTTDPEALAKYAAAGLHNVVLSQWACNRYAYGPTDGQPAYDATFVGQRYGARGRWMNQLRKAGVNVRCFGYGWENGRLSHSDMVRTFGCSRVNLNFSDSWVGSRWRRRAVRQIKGRVFEVPGCRGFLLTDRPPFLDDYFVLDEEMAAFEGGGELVERVIWWLEHDAERAAVAEAGYQRVISEHTYDHRFRQIFEALHLAA